MSLERKDVRAKLDEPLHAVLTEICRLEGIDIGQFVERLLVDLIRRRVHEAIALAGRLEDRGITGTVQKILEIQPGGRR